MLSTSFPRISTAVVVGACCTDTLSSCCFCLVKVMKEALRVLCCAELGAFALPQNVLIQRHLCSQLDPSCLCLPLILVVTATWLCSLLCYNCVRFVDVDILISITVCCQCPVWIIMFMFHTLQTTYCSSSVFKCRNGSTMFVLVPSPVRGTTSKPTPNLWPSIQSRLVRLWICGQ